MLGTFYLSKHAKNGIPFFFLQHPQNKMLRNQPFIEFTT
jgi:hypothetical protein